MFHYTKEFSFPRALVVFVSGTGLGFKASTVRQLEVGAGDRLAATVEILSFTFQKVVIEGDEKAFSGSLQVLCLPPTPQPLLPLFFTRSHGTQKVRSCKCRFRPTWTMCLMLGVCWRMLRPRMWPWRRWRSWKSTCLMYIIPFCFQNHCWGYLSFRNLELTCCLQIEPGEDFLALLLGS